MGLGGWAAEGRRGVARLHLLDAAGSEHAGACPGLDRRAGHGADDEADGHGGGAEREVQLCGIREKGRREGRQ